LKVREFIQEANVSIQHKVEEEIQAMQEEVDKLNRSDLFLALSDRKMNQAETQGIGTSLNLR